MGYIIGIVCVRSHLGRKNEFRLDLFRFRKVNLFLSELRRDFLGCPGNGGTAAKFLLSGFGMV